MIKIVKLRIFISARRFVCWQKHITANFQKGTLQIMTKAIEEEITRTRLQWHSGLACLEIRSRNEETINSTRNFLLDRRQYFLFVSELI